jgi:hypothetical protein
MDNQQRQGPGLPISGAAVVIALIFGSLFVQQLAFKGSRPGVPGHGVSTSAGLVEDVQARLWEDPFAAVRRHRADSTDTRHKIEYLAKRIAEEKTDEVTVLGVMVFGGPYAKNTERRIRSRHATLSALGALDYVPDNAEHLGYIKTDLISLSQNLRLRSLDLPVLQIYAPWWMRFCSQATDGRS